MRLFRVVPPFLQAEYNCETLRVETRQIENTCSESKIKNKGSETTDPEGQTIVLATVSPSPDSVESHFALLQVEVEVERED